VAKIPSPIVYEFNRNRIIIHRKNPYSLMNLNSSQSVFKSPTFRQTKKFETVMLWVGRPFRLGKRRWTSTPEQLNTQHCHPYENKNKKSPLSPSRIIAASLSILEPTLRTRITTAAMSRRVAPRPSAAACFPVSSPILTARRQVL
jgi:hypothetical protein